MIQARIADWLGVSRASVNEMVHRMREDGLVTIADEIHLTEEGRAIQEAAHNAHAANELEIVSGLSAADRAALVRGLKAFAAQVDTGGQA